MVSQSHLQQSSSPRSMPGTGGCIKYGESCGWWLTFGESNGASQVPGAWSFFLFFCLYSGNSPSCASFQPFPHVLDVLVATSSSSNLFIPLWPDDFPSLVHFFPPGQATHLLPPVFHFFIFTLSLCCIPFLYTTTPEWELHTPVTWLASLLSLRTNHHTHHPLYNNAAISSWQSSWTVWHLKMGLTGCSKTQVTNCQPMPCNIPKEKRPPLHHSGSLHSSMVTENCFHN